MEERNHFFDNVKGIAIVLVFFTHLLELLPREDPVVYLTFLGYSFLMCLFSFCSGYFSVHLTPRKALANLLYPYLIWQTLYYFLMVALQNTAYLSVSYLNYTFPVWLTWYLLSSFLWFLLMPLFRSETPRGALCSLTAAVVIGLAVGFDKSVQRYLSLSRTLVYFPFYLAGYYLCTQKAALLRVRDRLNGAVRRRVPRSGDRPDKTLLPALILASAACALVCFTLVWRKLDGNWFLSADGYEAGPRQFLFRGCNYVLAAVLSLFLMLLTPHRRTFLSRVGQNSITVYLLHGMLVRLLGVVVPTPVLRLPVYLTIPACLCLALAISLLLGNGAVKRFLSPLFSFPLPRRSRSHHTPQ